jgi:hypothetical protein
MPDAGQDVRAWLLAGYAHVAAGALLGLVAAAPSALVPLPLHVLVAAGGVAMVAVALAYAFAAPLTRRRLVGAWPSSLGFGLALAGDLVAVLSLLLHRDAVRGMTLLYGAAFVAPPLHLLVTALSGDAWSEGADLYEGQPPFRRGDLVATAGYAVGLAGLALAGALLVALPRGAASPGVALLLLGGAVPLFGGLLVFVLPRQAKAPLRRVTLAAAALAVQAIAAAGITVGLLTEGATGLRAPAGGLLLAALLALAAFWRLRAGDALLRLTGTLALLAGLAAALALAGGAPGPLFGAAIYATLSAAAALALAATARAAPLLPVAPPRRGRAPAWSAALAILGLFLLAPSAEFGRAAFPGAVALALAALLALWVALPMAAGNR